MKIKKSTLSVKLFTLRVIFTLRVATRATSITNYSKVRKCNLRKNGGKCDRTLFFHFGRVEYFATFWSCIFLELLSILSVKILVKNHNQTPLTMQNCHRSQCTNSTICDCSHLTSGHPSTVTHRSRGLDRGSENDVIPIYHSAFDLTLVKL